MLKHGVLCCDRFWTGSEPAPQVTNHVSSPWVPKRLQLEGQEPVSWQFDQRSRYITCWFPGFPDPRNLKTALCTYDFIHTYLNLLVSQLLLTKKDAALHWTSILYVSGLIWKYSTLRYRSAKFHDSLSRFDQPESVIPSTTLSASHYRWLPQLDLSSGL